MDEKRWSGNISTCKRHTFQRVVFDWELHNSTECVRPSVTSVLYIERLKREIIIMAGNCFTFLSLLLILKVVVNLSKAIQQLIISKILKECPFAALSGLPIIIIFVVVDCKNTMRLLDDYTWRCMKMNHNLIIWKLDYSYI